MSNKIAVGIIHGVGVQKANFADGMIKEIRKRFASEIKKYSPSPEKEIVIKPIFWAPVLQKEQDRLWSLLNKGGKMSYKKLRRFIVDFAADAIAYQPSPQDCEPYNNIHKVIAKTFKSLAKEAGPTAPLCVIAHSLGTIISSNYIYDLESNKINPKIRSAMGDTPLDKGETLALYYTLGSPIALWSLRYSNFGKPITVPSPKLKKHYNKLTGEWINFYDKDDVIGYPLKTINPAYKKAVNEDRAIDVGTWWSSWNFASHVEYWKDNDVTKPITRKLVAIWKKINKKG